jgi:hypothetical protein
MTIKPTDNGILSIIGFILSAYSVYVEYKIEHRNDDSAIEGEEFKALCDIESIGASCRCDGCLALRDVCLLRALCYL